MTTIAEAAAKQQSDAIYVAWAQAGHFFHTPAMTMAQLKAVTAALNASFPPPTPGGMIVDVDSGDMILPIMDGPWKGQYLSWNPAAGHEKHFPLHDLHYHVGYQRAGCYGWWTLKA